jgi:hypothetical protein
LCPSGHCQGRGSPKTLSKHEEDNFDVFTLRTHAKALVKNMPAYLKLKRRRRVATVRCPVAEVQRTAELPQIVILRDSKLYPQISRAKTFLPPSGKKRRSLATDQKFDMSVKFRPKFRLQFWPQFFWWVFY